MRVLGAVALTLVALLVCAAGALYAALPWLLAPTVPAPATPTPASAASLLSTLAGAPGGEVSVRLDATQLDEVLALAAGGGQGPLTAVWATLGPGSADLYVDATVPRSVALPRLRGREVGLELRVAPRASADGVLTLTVEDVRVGRMRLGAFLPLARAVPLVAELVPGSHPWWSVRGATLVLAMGAAPPLPAGPAQIRAVPTAVTVTPAALTVTGTAQVHLTLPAQELDGALSDALLARAGPGVIPVLTFQSGRAVLTLLASGSAAAYALSAAVPAPGILRVAVAGPGAAPAAAVGRVLTAALGATPSWLSVGSADLTVDWRRMTGIDVGGGLRLRFLPEAVSVQPFGVSAWTEVLPA